MNEQKKREGGKEGKRRRGRTDDRENKEKVVETRQEEKAEMQKTRKITDVEEERDGGGEGSVRLKGLTKLGIKFTCLYYTTHKRI